jgi:hypothetical protein
MMMNLFCRQGGRRRAAAGGGHVRDDGGPEAGAGGGDGEHGAVAAGAGLPRGQAVVLRLRRRLLGGDRKHGAKVRAPFAYFSSSSGGGAAERGGGGGAADADAEFLRAWTSMKVTASAGRTMHTHVPAVSSDRGLARTRVVCRTSTRSWSAGSRAPRRSL